MESLQNKYLKQIVFQINGYAAIMGLDSLDEDITYVLQNESQYYNVIIKLTKIDEPNDSKGWVYFLHGVDNRRLPAEQPLKIINYICTSKTTTWKP